MFLPKTKLKVLFCASILPCIALLLFVQSGTLRADEMGIYGYAEHGMIYPGEMEFTARMDSGATNSSINAVEIKEFKKDGDPWVRFTVENHEGDQLELEKPLKRVARILQHDGSYQKRPVVEMGICIGNIYKEVEINLINRSGLTYPLLVGRSYLKNSILIDSGFKYSRKPECDLESVNE